APDCARRGEHHEPVHPSTASAGHTPDVSLDGETRRNVDTGTCTASGARCGVQGAGCRVQGARVQGATVQGARCNGATVQGGTRPYSGPAPPQPEVARRYDATLASTVICIVPR